MTPNPFNNPHLAYSGSLPYVQDLGFADADGSHFHVASLILSSSHAVSPSLLTLYRTLDRLLDACKRAVAVEPSTVSKSLFVAISDHIGQ